MKILHLATDDKFLSYALPFFEKSLPKSNDVCVYSYLDKLNYVNDISATICKDYSHLNSIKLNEYGLIVIHSLIDFWYNFIVSLPSGVKVLWIGWGHDYYDIINIKLTLDGKPGLLKNLTKKIKNYSKSNMKRKVINRIDYFSPVLENEYEMVKEKFKGGKFPKYISFNYGCLEDNFSVSSDANVKNKNSILIGNSATENNNHKEIFSLLKDRNINREIICPLSYGDKLYGERISELGRNYFGSNFSPLLCFMSGKEYIQVIRSANTVIMNHIRQQAYGNIIITMYSGSTIFLRGENPIYIFLKAKGAIIFSIQELEANMELLDYSLTFEEKSINKQILESLFAKNVIQGKVDQIIELIHC